MFHKFSRVDHESIWARIIKIYLNRKKYSEVILSEMELAPLKATNLVIHPDCILIKAKMKYY